MGAFNKVYKNLNEVPDVLRNLFDIDTIYRTISNKQSEDRTRQLYDIANNIPIEEDYSTFPIVISETLFDDKYRTIINITIHKTKYIQITIGNDLKQTISTIKKKYNISSNEDLLKHKNSIVEYVVLTKLFKVNILNW